jgi:hypothetical protein
MGNKWVSRGQRPTEETPVQTEDEKSTKRLARWKRKNDYSVTCIAETGLSQMLLNS